MATGAARPSSWRCSSPGRPSTRCSRRETLASPTGSSSSRPGITIRDRLRVLLPEDAENYYDLRDLVPADLRAASSRRGSSITNFHAFLLKDAKEIKGVAKNTRLLLQGRPQGRPVQGDAAGDGRAASCATSGADKQQIVVLNDEAHHCYRDKPLAGAARSADKEQQDANERGARLVPRPRGDRKARRASSTVYDLSATPFFLRGSGYNEGTSSRGSVSDFSLMDAIESGIVKVPRIAGRRRRRPTTLVDLPATLGLRRRRSCRRRAAKDDGRRTGSRPRSSKARCAASTALREGVRALGDGARAATARRRRCSSSSARTPSSPSSSSTGSPASRSSSDDDGASLTSPASSPLFSQRRRRQPGRAAAHDPRRLRAARVRRGAEGRLQEGRRRGDRGVQGRVPHAQPRRRRRRSSPTRTCCAR